MRKQDLKDYIDGYDANKGLWKKKTNTRSDVMEKLNKIYELKSIQELADHEGLSKKQFFNV